MIRAWEGKGIYIYIYNHTTKNATCPPKQESLSGQYIYIETVKYHIYIYTVFNTLWSHKFIISSILSVAEGGSNDIYDFVSSYIVVYVKYLQYILKERSWNCKT